MLNMMKLRDYPIDINNFNCNVSDVINSIYIGPQGELLESVDAFNQQYETNLEITKHFTLKPGGYDKLKKAYSNWGLRWDMRPRGISSIFNRINEHRWRANNMASDAISLETKMIDLRTTGIGWQDNAEDFTRETDRLKDVIISAIESCKTLYPNVDISVKLIPNTIGRINPQVRGRYNPSSRNNFPEFGSPDLENPAEYIIIFYTHIKDPEMTVHILNANESVEKYTFPCHDMIVASGTYFLPMISRNWGRNVLRTDHPSSRNYSYFLEAMYLSPFGIDAHPYIGKATDTYTWDLEEYKGHSNHICTGNMGDDIRDTLLNSQIEAHITYLVTWLTNYYIPQTNPLNRIAAMKGVGENNLFRDWSASGLNSFDVTTNPHECSLGTKISSSIEKHAKAEVHGAYSTSHIAFTLDDPEYLSRKEDYIDHIKLEDLPCNDCSWSNDCPQEVNILTILKEKSYTPMEEAYLGMFWEIAKYNHTVLGSHNPRPARYDFIEEVIRQVDYHDPAPFYTAISESNACVKGWYLANEEEPNLSWISNRFKSRIKTVMCLSERNRLGLLAEALNEKSEFVWTMDSVENFRSSRRAIKPDPVQIREEDISIEPEIEEVFPDMEHNAQLTPEERTLQWATTMGGSTNL